MTQKVICFDLEGPLSPQDNAYEVMGLIDEGHKIFEVISRYDDILTLEERCGYEPGDTLSLIVPFLIHYNISEKNIKEVSNRAKIVDGTKYIISKLNQLGWSPYIISTSYQQHAHNIGGKIGVLREKIYCTYFPLDEFKAQVGDTETAMIEEFKGDIIELYANLNYENRIKNRLDQFYCEDIKDTVLEDIMNKMKVVGGQRKVDAAKKIAEETNSELSDMIVVGDSITDYKMLKKIKNEGGISIVFNGNDYAIPYANIGLATTDMRFLLIVIAGYMRGGYSCVIDTVKDLEKNHESYMKNPASIPDKLIPPDIKKFLISKINEPGFFQPHFHYLPDRKNNFQEIIRIHKESRAHVRGDAAKLG